LEASQRFEVEMWSSKLKRLKKKFCSEDNVQMELTWEVGLVVAGQRFDWMAVLG
jgi:hypothetical protein